MSGFARKAALRARTFAKTFARDDRGNVSIEFVFWIPIMVMLLMIMAQGSLMFMVQANYGDAARDAARLVSRHAMDEDEALEMILAGAVTGGPVGSAEVEVDAGLVRVRIATRVSDLMPFDVFGLTEGFEIAAQAVHNMEPM